MAGCARFVSGDCIRGGVSAHEVPHGGCDGTSPESRSESDSGWLRRFLAAWLGVVMLSGNQSDHAGERFSRLRWLMIGFAFLATVINYLDRQALSVVAPMLREEFHMSNEAYGYVLSAFMLAYTISNGVSGPLVDRLGTKLGYAVCMFVWSTAGILHAFARGAWSLAGFRFVLGVGEAGNWPAGVKVATEWFPAQERALACGIFNKPSAFSLLVLSVGLACSASRSGLRAADSAAPAATEQTGSVTGRVRDYRPRRATHAGREGHLLKHRADLRRLIPPESARPSRGPKGTKPR